MERLLGEHGIQKDNARGRDEFRSRMEEWCRGEGNGEEKTLWATIRLGGNSERRILLSALEHWEEMEKTARRLIREFVRQEGMAFESFQRLRKGDVRKPIRLAQELRKETTMKTVA